MPKPKYILCAESISIDQVTNLVSFYHAIEGFTVSPVPVDGEKAEGMVPVRPTSMSFVGVAVWERTADDSSHRELDYENTLTLPGHAEQTVSEGKFRMQKRFHRFTSRFYFGGLPEPIEPGIIRYTSRVKAADQGDWLSQTYEIPLDVAGSWDETPG